MIALSLLVVQLFLGSRGLPDASGFAERSAAAESDDWDHGRARRLWRAGVCHHDRVDVENISSFARRLLSQIQSSSFSLSTGNSSLK